MSSVSDITGDLEPPSELKKTLEKSKYLVKGTSGFLRASCIVFFKYLLFVSFFSVCCKELTSYKFRYTITIFCKINTDHITKYTKKYVPRGLCLVGLLPDRATVLLGYC